MFQFQSVSPQGATSELSGAAKVSTDGRFLQADPYIAEMLGLPEDELAQCRFHDMTHPDDLARDVAQIERLLSRGQGHYSLFKRYIHASGRPIWIELNVVLTRKVDAKDQYFDVTIRQAPASAATLQELHDKAFRDPLTGHPNRHALDEHLAGAEARTGRTGRPFAFVMLDLDGFKLINDTHGHHVGDALLGAVSERLQGVIFQGDFAARMGGDEFGIVLQDITHESDLNIRIAQLQMALQPIYKLPDGEFQMTCSLGWAVYPSEATTVTDVMQAADQAMYRCKRAMFSPSSRRSPQAVVHSAAGLRKIER
ncbi:MAG: diguanylate cyclase [Roseovarius sp.]